MAADHALIDVNGVGYVVHASSRTLARVGPIGTPVRLLVETQVREDAITLFGFWDHGERDWFGLLTTVQGVGAKVALSIQGVLSPEELTMAVAAQDKNALTRASGVGPKLGARIVAELKDKVGGMALGIGAGSDKESGAPRPPDGPQGPMEDAISALVNLGYRRVEAFAAITKAGHEAKGTISLDQLIRAGLKELSQ